MVQFRKRKDGSTYPITDKKSSHYTGQEDNPQRRKEQVNSLKADIKDEHAASKHYHRKAEQTKDEEDQATYESMSFDEARHEENLKKMAKDNE